MELTVLGQTLQQGYDFKFLGQITLINGVLSNTKSILKWVFEEEKVLNVFSCISCHYLVGDFCELTLSKL